jgi:myo-inositol-1(or 4)-monophosphatase
MKTTDIKKTAISIARDAGELLRMGYHQAKAVEAKSSAIDLVTQYDMQAEALIARRLEREFPRDAILGEEGHRRESANGHDRIWIVDPLDGTINFAHGFPVFAVSLALYETDRPLVGVIYDPLRDECFHAAAGDGAYLQRAGGVQQRLQVSTAPVLMKSLLATGFPYDRHDSSHDNVPQFGAFLKRAQGIRRAGAAALDVAYVAAGRLDGFWEFKLGSWDIAAAVLLVQEAGGRASTMDGTRFKLSPWKPNELIASNGNIHDEMVSVLQEIPV